MASEPFDRSSRIAPSPPRRPGGATTRLRLTIRTVTSCSSRCRSEMVSTGDTYGRPNTVLQSEAPVRNRPLGPERGSWTRRQDLSGRYTIAGGLREKSHSRRDQYPLSNHEHSDD